ncbi:unnamed protein product [Dracunculus medinensis]|uniref:3'(2'),5'-bisphosphate nucleotidase 1 n=1 Tax=Dracunculus medinensis TaxID=318479 RepID=A0A0N4UPW4_DRAME|nr:unnamed protein product [Dracunculus medinensis]
MWERSSFLMRLVASSVSISESAGRIIKDIIRKGDLKIVNKGVGGITDLQTEADRLAQDCIVQSLQKKFGGNLIIIGEEVLFHKTNCTLLEQITVLIGISYKGRPIAGIVHQPYYGKDGGGRTVWAVVGVGVHGIKISNEQKERVVVTTKNHSTALVVEALDALKSKGLLDKVQKVGGAGFKVLKCLEGAAAYVYANSGCKKWDTAAPEAVLKAAGGNFTDVSGRLFYYGADAQVVNTGGIIATSNWVKHEDIVNGIPDHIKDALPEYVNS